MELGTVLPGNTHDAFFTLGALNNGFLSIGPGNDFIFQFRDFGSGSGAVDAAFYNRSASAPITYVGNLSFVRGTVPDAGSSPCLLAPGLVAVVGIKRRLSK